MRRYPAPSRTAAVITTLAHVLMTGTIQAGKVWYPVDVDVWEPPFNAERQLWPIVAV